MHHTRKIAQKSRLKIAAKTPKTYIGIETITKFHSNCADVNKETQKYKKKISKIDLEVVYF